MIAADPVPALDLLRGLFHYNPLTGIITYAQQRGPKSPGDHAGTTVRGVLHVYIAGAYHRAPAVAWTLFHGSDPAPMHVIPVDGNPDNMEVSNLALSEHPFRRPNYVPGRRRARRPAWEKNHIRYSAAEGLWKAFHNRKLLGPFLSRAEAVAAKRAAMEHDQSQQEKVNAD